MRERPGPLVLAAGEARVELAPAAGGAIAGYAFRGHDVLRPTPADARAAGDVRRHACYPLVPYSNRIADARLAAAGTTHALARNFGDHPHAIHGVGWQRPWTVALADADSALLALDHDPAGDGAAAWPWPFRATQAFALAAVAGGALLTAKLALANTGATAFPFGLGWHPFFPLAADSELGFAAAGVWENDATRIPRRHAAVPAAWRFDPPRAVGDAELDNVFTDWRGRAVLRRPAHGLEVALAADRACPFLVVYVPPGRDFVALEPVTHMTDAFNRAARGERGTGTRTLEPGAVFSCTMQISVRVSR
jgi:aldose 1-epimerase